jgi:hypothetical protein
MQNGNRFDIIFRKNFQDMNLAAAHPAFLIQEKGIAISIPHWCDRSGYCAKIEF